MADGALSDPGSSAQICVERVEIRDFRGIGSCEVGLEQHLTLLVGRNNSGKSRILRAIAVALGTQPERDDRTVGTETEPQIDIFFAPPPDGTDEEVFHPAVSGLFGARIQQVSAVPI